MSYILSNSLSISPDKTFYFLIPLCRESPGLAHGKGFLSEGIGWEQVFVFVFFFQCLESSVPLIGYFQSDFSIFLLMAHQEVISTGQHVKMCRVGVMWAILMAWEVGPRACAWIPNLQTRWRDLPVSGTVMYFLWIFGGSGCWAYCGAWGLLLTELRGTIWVARDQKLSHMLRGTQKSALNSCLTLLEFYKVPGIKVRFLHALSTFQLFGPSFCLGIVLKMLWVCRMHLWTIFGKIIWTVIGRDLWHDTHYLEFVLNRKFMGLYTSQNMHNLQSLWLTCSVRNWKACDQRNR